MTALEAIPKITELLARLIKLSKNREIGTLVQEIQQHQLILYGELMEKDARIRQLEQELAESNAEEIRIHRLIEFRRGRRTGGKWMAFCPKCKMPVGGARAPGGTPMAFCSAGCGWTARLEISLEEVTKELQE